MTAAGTVQAANQVTVQFVRAETPEYWAAIAMLGRLLAEEILAEEHTDGTHENLLDLRMGAVGRAAARADVDPERPVLPPADRRAVGP